MDISRNAQSQPSPLRYDFTRASREVIQQRQPLDKPVKTDAEPPVDPEEAAKSVKEARDAHREQRQTRIANARAHYTHMNAPHFAQEVTDARNAYRAKLDERAKNTSGAGEASGDRLEISEVAKRMVDRTTQLARQSETSDASRAERLAELKQLHEQGRLNTDELIARAAHRMLERE